MKHTIRKKKKRTKQVFANENKKLIRIPKREKELLLLNNVESTKFNVLIILRYPFLYFNCLSSYFLLTQEILKVSPNFNFNL